MKIDKRTIQEIFLGAAGCIVLYWLLHETDRVKTIWGTLSNMLRPFVIGAVLAFIFNVPMRAIERGMKGIQKPGLRRVAAMLATVLAVAVILAGVVLLLIPQITETVQSLAPKIVDFFVRIEGVIANFLADNPELMEWIYSNTEFESIDWAALIQKAVGILSTSVSVIAVKAFSAVGTITGGIVDVVIGLVFMIYCLANKEVLSRQGRRIIYSILPEHACD